MSKIWTSNSNKARPMAHHKAFLNQQSIMRRTNIQYIYDQYQKTTQN